MSIQSIAEHWPIISGAIVIVIAFGAHIYGKFKERTDTLTFGKWFAANKEYIGYSLCFGVLGTVMKGELMDLVGITKPMTYLFATWYAGAHIISRVLGVKAASKARKA